MWFGLEKVAHKLERLLTKKNSRNDESKGNVEKKLTNAAKSEPNHQR